MAGFEGGEDWTYEDVLKESGAAIARAEKERIAAIAAAKVLRNISEKLSSLQGISSVRAHELLELTDSSSRDEALAKLDLGATLVDGVITSREAQIHNNTGSADWARRNLSQDTSAEFV